MAKSTGIAIIYYAGFQAKGLKCISAKIGFWSALLFWLITKIQPGSVVHVQFTASSYKFPGQHETVRGKDLQIAILLFEEGQSSTNFSYNIKLRNSKTE